MVSLDTSGLRRTTLDDSVLLSLIRQCVVDGRYRVTRHAFEKHGLEGFTYQDVKNVVLSGRIIERHDHVARLTICGMTDDIQERSEFLGKFLHCVVEWDDINMIVIVTAYRPSIHLWRTAFERLSEII